MQREICSHLLHLIIYEGLLDISVTQEPMSSWVTTQSAIFTKIERFSWNNDGSVEIKKNQIALSYVADEQESLETGRQRSAVVVLFWQRPNLLCHWIKYIVIFRKGAVILSGAFAVIILKPFVMTIFLLFVTDIFKVNTVFPRHVYSDRTIASSDFSSPFFI